MALVFEMIIMRQFGGIAVEQKGIIRLRAAWPIYTS
jgi:hypothetical protein